MGVPAGAFSVFTGRSSRATRGVSLWSAVSVGKALTPDVPRTIEGRYWKWLMKSSLLYGDGCTGPFGFGPTPTPLAASPTTDLRFGLASASTGYAATGTRPTSCQARLRRPPLPARAGRPRSGENPRPPPSP